MGAAVCIALVHLLVVDEKGQDEEHLEETADGADLYGVDSLDGFHHQADDGEEDCGQESIEQAETYTLLWFLCICGEERKTWNITSKKMTTGLEFVCTDFHKYKLQGSLSMH